MRVLGIKTKFVTVDPVEAHQITVFDGLRAGEGALTLEFRPGDYGTESFEMIQERAFWVEAVGRLFIGKMMRSEDQKQGGVLERMIGTPGSIGTSASFGFQKSPEHLGAEMNAILDRPASESSKC